MTTQGVKDPDLLELVKVGCTQSYALSANGWAFALQTVASAKLPMTLRYVEGALLEADASLAPAEHGTTYISLPSEFRPKELHADQLCEVVNGYGRCDEHQLHRLTFSKFCVREQRFVHHLLTPAC